MKYSPKYPVATSFEEFGDKLHLNMLNTRLLLDNNNINICFSPLLRIFYCECVNNISAVMFLDKNHHRIGLIKTDYLHYCINRGEYPQLFYRSAIRLHFHEAHRMFIGLCFTRINESEAAMLDKCTLTYRGDIILKLFRNGVTLRVSGNAAIHYPDTISGAAMPNKPLAGIFVECDSKVENITSLPRSPGCRASFLTLLDTARSFDYDIVRPTDLVKGDRVRFEQSDAFCLSSNENGAIVENFNTQNLTLLTPERYVVKIIGAK